MQKIVDYEIVCASTMEKLIANVKEHFAYHYQPLGGISFSGSLYIQAILTLYWG